VGEKAVIGVVYLMLEIWLSGKSGRINYNSILHLLLFSLDIL